MDSDDPHLIASHWLSLYAAALAHTDADELSRLFLPNGWLRDLLVFTWDFRSLAGREKIVSYLSDRISRARIRDICLNETPDLSPRILPLPGGQATGVDFAFAFECLHGHGCAHVRLVQDDDDAYRAYTVLMELEDLVGHEERSTLPYRDDVTSLPGRDMQRELSEYVRHTETNPDALIVGGGQTGLQIAARFKQMNISALVIERTTRIGDSWRKRYPSLTLQTVRKHHTLLYQPYPSNWPEYTPRDKMADWVEHYADIQDIVVWTNTELRTRPSYDPVSRTWSVTVHRSGAPVAFRPAHIVLATGTLGRPYMPALAGMDVFRGTYMHSSDFPGGAALVGKRVVVVGAAQSASDICEDLALHGAAAVTMVQRSPTCVMSRDFVNMQVRAAFPEDVPMHIADLRYASHPLALTRKVLIEGQQVAWDAHAELHAKLKKGGVAVNLGPEGQGVYPLVYERYGGFWMDKGCADHIANGTIRVKGLTTVERFTSNGIILGGGTEIPADVVIFATGYVHMREMHKELFGDDVIDRTDEDWGLDAEGECNGSYRPCGFPGLWYASGDFSTARIHSKQLALQIKAIELGLIQYDGEREGAKEKATRT